MPTHYAIEKAKDALEKAGLSLKETRDRNLNNYIMGNELAYEFERIIDETIILCAIKAKIAENESRLASDEILDYFDKSDIANSIHWRTGSAK